MIEDVPLTTKLAGGAGVIETEMAAGGVIVTVAVAVLVPSLVDVAVIVTVFPVGTADGAVKIVVAALAV